MWGQLIDGLFSGLGMGMQAKASYDQAKANNLAAQWNAGIARQNATDLDSLAVNQRLIGQKQANDLRLQVDGIIGQQRAITGASGVKVDVGSSAHVQASTRSMGEYDAQTLIYNNEMAAMDYERQARNQRSQANLMLATKQNPWMAAAAPVVSGVTGLMQHYSQQSYIDKLVAKMGK